MGSAPWANQSQEEESGEVQDDSLPCPTSSARLLRSSRVRQQGRYPVHLFTALDSDCLTPHMNIRPIPIAQVFHIFRSIRLRNDVFHVRVHESLKLVESVPARTVHISDYRRPSPGPCPEPIAANSKWKR